MTKPRSASGWFPVHRALTGTTKRPSPWFRMVNGHTWKVMTFFLTAWRDEAGEIRATMQDVSDFAGGNRGTNSRAIQTLIADGKLELVERGTPGKPSVYRLPACCASATTVVAPVEQGCCASDTKVVAQRDPTCCASGAPLKNSPETFLKINNNNTPPPAAAADVVVVGSDVEEDEGDRTRAARRRLENFGVLKGKLDELLAKVPGLSAEIIGKLDDITRGRSSVGALIRAIETDGPRLAREQQEREAAEANEAAEREALYARCAAAYQADPAKVEASIVQMKRTGESGSYGAQAVSRLGLRRDATDRIPDEHQPAIRALAVEMWEARGEPLTVEAEVEHYRAKMRIGSHMRGGVDAVPA